MGLLWAALLLIAAQMLPSIAEAHAGHVHRSAEAAISHRADVAGHEDRSSIRKASSHTLEVSSADVRIDPGSSSSSPGCTGGCCGAGTACCGALLFAGVASAFPDLRQARQRHDLLPSVPDGINPDAIRKPPKSRS